MKEGSVKNNYDDEEEAESHGWSKVDMEVKQSRGWYSYVDR